MLRLLVYLLDVMVLVLGLGRLSRALRRLVGAPRVEFWSWQSGEPREAPPPTVQRVTARDPVCGTFVSTELAHRLIRGTETLHFCSRECLERYQKIPSNA